MVAHVVVPAAYDDQVAMDFGKEAVQAEAAVVVVVVNEIDLAVVVVVDVVDLVVVVVVNGVQFVVVVVGGVLVVVAVVGEDQVVVVVVNDVQVVGAVEDVAQAAEHVAGEVVQAGFVGNEVALLAVVVVQGNVPVLEILPGVVVATAVQLTEFVVLASEEHHLDNAELLKS